MSSVKTRKVPRPRWRRNKDRINRIAKGDCAARMVPCGPCRNHALALEYAGMPIPAIAEAAGIADVTIYKIVRGERQMVHLDTHAAIMSVTHKVVGASPNRLAPAVGSARRIQALMRLGWTAHDIADAADMAVVPVRKIAAGQVSVEFQTIARVKQAYDLLSLSVGPSDIGRARAKAKGYLLPLDWESVDMDDPCAEPLMFSRPDGRRHDPELVAARRMI